MRKRAMIWVGIVSLVAGVAIIVAGCAGPQGPQGPQGPPGDVTTVPRFAIQLVDGKPACERMCHNAPAPFIQPPTGAYTLAWEANNGWAGHNFDPLGEPKTLNDCLACHAVGTGARAGKGNVAPKSLRDIVHPVHIGSPHFMVTLEDEEEERPGNCFTCHVVSGPSTTGLYE